MDTYRHEQESTRYAEMTDEELMEYFIDLQKLQDSDIERHRNVAKRLLGRLVFEATQRLQ